MDKHFLSGIQATIPACLGVVPVGISIGLLAMQAGMTGLQAVFMSAMVMAGSSQLLAISMMTQGAAVSAILLGTFCINLRHVVMSGSVMGRLKKTTLARRLLGSFALCDESFAVYSLSQDDSYTFLLGSNTALYLTFVGSTLLGTLMTNFLPQLVIDSFGIAFYAAFLGLLIPSIRGCIRLIALAGITGAANWLLQLFLPASWSVILAMVLGAAAGAFRMEDSAQEQEGHE